jgi:transposase
MRDLSQPPSYSMIRKRRKHVALCAQAQKRERLDFLADNPRFTKRFAFYVGRRCRQASIRDVAQELKLDWDCGLNETAPR